MALCLSAIQKADIGHFLRPSHKYKEEKQHYILNVCKHIYKKYFMLVFIFRSKQTATINQIFLVFIISLLQILYYLDMLLLTFKKEKLNDPSPLA